MSRGGQRRRDDPSEQVPIFPGPRRKAIGWSSWSCTLTCRQGSCCAPSQIQMAGVGDLLAGDRTPASTAGRRGSVQPSTTNAGGWLLPVGSAWSPGATRTPSKTSSALRRSASQVRLEVRQTAVRDARRSRGDLALLELDAHPDVDVIIVTRGGGSLEDLLRSPTKGLVRTVAALLTLVISAIGRETDLADPDDVADARAATPTHAATLAVPQVADVASYIDTLRRRIRSRMQGETSSTTASFAELPQPSGAGDPHVLLGPPKDFSNARVRLFVRPR